MLTFLLFSYIYSKIAKEKFICCMQVEVEPREKKKEQVKTCKSKSVDEYSNRSELFAEDKKGKNVREKCQ